LNGASMDKKEMKKVDIGGKVYDVPSDVAEYLIDLYQLMQSIYTRVVEERKVIIEPTYQPRPFIVDFLKSDSSDSLLAKRPLTEKPILRKRRRLR